MLLMVPFLTDSVKRGPQRRPLSSSLRWYHMLPGPSPLTHCIFMLWVGGRGTHTGSEVRGPRHRADDILSEDVCSPGLCITPPHPPFPLLTRALTCVFVRLGIIKVLSIVYRIILYVLIPAIMICYTVYISYYMFLSQLL